MIIDGRTRNPAEAEPYDVLIVGTGPAGITLAMEMADTGLRIALLESGGLEFDDRAQALNDGTLSALDTTDLTGARMRLLGGTSNHWGGHCLPLDPIDFARAPLSGMTGWPMSYDDMLPHYRTASQYCDIGELGYALSDVAGLSTDDLLIGEADKIDVNVIRQSGPTLFGEKYLPALEASETINVWLWSTVVGLEPNADGRIASVLTRSIEGTPGRFTAREVVLACGAVENARLMLHNNAQFEVSFGNQSDLLGGCYMDHPVGGAAFLHLEPAAPPRAEWDHGLRSTDGIYTHLVWRLSDAILERERLNNTQFFVIPLSADPAERALKADARRGMGGLKNVAKWALGRAPDEVTLSGAYCDFIQNADAMAVHAYREQVQGYRVTRTLLRYESEQQPTRESYVALEAEARDMFGVPLPRLHWSPTEDDRDSIVRSALQIGAVAGARGLGRVELEDHFDDRYWDAKTAWHQMGTTRMAPAASDGVVDPTCKVHGTQNLYCAGASVFPSGGRANPTLTVVALSVRLAAHLTSKLGA